MKWIINLFYGQNLKFVYLAVYMILISLNFLIDIDFIYTLKFTNFKF
jgi:hypothetical protein